MKYLFTLLLLLSASLHAQPFWRPVNSAGQNATFWGVATNPDVTIMAVGTGGSIITSSDGIFWSGSPSGTTNWLLAAAYGNSTWVTVGDAGTILWTDSSLRWTSATYSGVANTQKLNGITYGNGQFVAVGEGGVIVTSPDGKTWTTRNSTVTTALRGIAYGLIGGVGNISASYVACGASGVILYSSDGVSWLRASSPTSSFLEAIAISRNTAVIVGQNGTILSSGSGSVAFGWTARASGTTVWLRGASADAAGNFAASGENGTLLTSSNTTTWTSTQAGTLANPVRGNLVAMTFSANLNHFISVGEAGAINLSPDSSPLVNVATRGFVGTDSNVLIAGFVISGTMPKRVLVRAVGPGLSIFGLTGLLAQPVLKIYDGQGTLVVQNTGWTVANETLQSQIILATTLTGAFPLTVGSADSVLLRTLAPGAYTAQVSGVNNSTGTALVEVYQMP